jgi:glycosyltransferase involved in cell wall biosynthesis
MPENLSSHTKLLVVSDTGMYKCEQGFFAFGPVVKELLELLKKFDNITWIGFNRLDQLKNKSYLRVPDKINIIMLDRVGGRTILDKLKILKKYPEMYQIIDSEIKKADIVHSRSPSNPAFIAMLLSRKYSDKKFWFKYAGNWIEKASKFYEFQRFVLKRLKKNSYITVNGKWDTSNKNIIHFENPCLSKEDRVLGEKIIKNKKINEQVTLCFVGALNKHKGVHLIIKALKNISDKNKIYTFHFVGDSNEKGYFKNLSKDLDVNIIYHGFMQKHEINDIYAKSHFIILPSKSEGFPKVIGEAMNFGCVPIVSEVSSINQYISNNENGFLINPLTTEKLTELIEKSINIKPDLFNKMIIKNYKIAKKFTYSYFLKRIEQTILNV